MISNLEPLKSRQLNRHDRKSYPYPTGKKRKTSWLNEKFNLMYRYNIIYIYVNNKRDLIPTF